MRKKVFLPILLAGSVIVLGGAIAWLFVSGMLVWTGSAGQVSTATVICGSDRVTQYNQARDVVIRGTATTPEPDIEGLTRLSDEIKASSGFEGDPTCQTILFWTAYLKDDYTAAKSAYEGINSLYEKRLYADSNTQGIQSISSYQRIVDLMSPENQSKGLNGDEQ